MLTTHNTPTLRLPLLYRGKGKAFKSKAVDLSTDLKSNIFTPPLKFGKLTPCWPLTVESRWENFSQTSVRWLFLCDCGQLTTAFASDVIPSKGRSTIRSCGCITKSGKPNKGTLFLQKNTVNPEDLRSSLDESTVGA